jgi:DNA (cytosine-5)-methyltransferase 1
MNDLPVLSLFCGPGGFDVGFAESGFRTALAYDVDPVAISTHRRNHPAANALQANLLGLNASAIAAEWKKRCEIGPVGIIGGSPCQPFSVSNVQKFAADPRRRLLGRFATLLDGLQGHFDIPFFVFENVPGLLQENYKRLYKRFLKRLSQAGFQTSYQILDANDFGVPQRRKRVFVVGINKDIFPEVALAGFKFPVPGVARQTVGDVLMMLPEPVTFQEMKTVGKSDHHVNHWCMTPRSSRFTDETSFDNHSGSRSFRKLSWDRPSYTVAYGNREVHVHPDGRRRLSVYEAMLLQGFPSDYVIEGTLSDQIRLVSDAVCPPVAAAVASALRNQLRLA